MSLFHGLSAFPITPTDEHGVVNTDDVMMLAKHLSAHKVDSIGLLGSTGIYAYLKRTERKRAIRAAIQAVGGKTPLIVGVGSLRTDDAQNLASDAAAEGADGLLLAPVSYTPLTQEEAFQHYKAVAEVTDLPLCIYNNPSTTHFTFSQELLGRLADLPTVQAVKMPPTKEGDVAAELKQMRESPVGQIAIGYSGDWIAAEALLAGCDGWFSVLGGFLPKIARALVDAAATEDIITVERHQQNLLPLWELFREVGSLRVAYAAANHLKLSNALPPRPILPLAECDQNRVVAALASLDQ